MCFMGQQIDPIDKSLRCSGTLYASFIKKKSQLAPVALISLHPQRSHRLRSNRFESLHTDRDEGY